MVVAVDPENRDALTEELRRREITSIATRSASEALERLESEPCDLVIAESRLRHDSGVELLATVRERWPDVARVLVSDGEGSSIVPAVINRAGVCYLLPRDWDGAALEASLRARAARPQAPPARDAGAPPSPRVARMPRIIGDSAAMRELLALVAKVAQTDSTVLVTGETGSGKELIGRAIHDLSRRRDRVFSAVNSAAFPESLLESELFGHRRGSFTGANANSKGLFEHADRGTVFLDEVAEMPLSMQAKLLRFLQTGEIRPVGSETTRTVDVRLVAATNKDLVEEVAKGNFREDLYYRLAVIPLQVPSLRDRIEDVPPLARHFLSSLGEKTGRPVGYLEPAALELLEGYDWPGNVRELENVIERAVALSSDGSIQEEHLPRFRRNRSLKRSDAPLESLPVLERRHIIETLDRVGWNRKRAAELLQISTTTLWRRLKEFGIDGKAPRGPVLADRLEARAIER
jgi:DNA-binding NtrC family response regulator